MSIDLSLQRVGSFATNQPPDAVVARSVAGGQFSAVAASVGQSSETKRAPSDAEVRAALGRLNAAAEQVNRDFNFSVDEKTKQVILQVLNHDDGEVLYQIPSEEALRLSSSLDELSGVLFNKKA